MKLRTLIYIVLAGLIVGITVINASWMAPAPQSALKLIAVRGVDPDKDGCITTDGIRQAYVARAEYVIMPVSTKAGCASVDEVITNIPNRKLIFDAAGADEIAALQAVFTKRKRSFDMRYALTGAAAGTAVASFPGRWVWTQSEGRACFTAYLRTGWAGQVPGICRGKTMIFGIDEQWLVWGWPNRFQQRMADAGVQVILADRAEGKLKGISTLAQIPKIPRDFTGYLLVDDIDLIGRAIRN